MKYKCAGRVPVVGGLGLFSKVSSLFTIEQVLQDSAEPLGPLQTVYSVLHREKTIASPKILSPSGVFNPFITFKGRK
jgi:hypothetical protein